MRLHHSATVLSSYLLLIPVWALRKRTRLNSSRRSVWWKVPSRLTSLDAGLGLIYQTSLLRSLVRRPTRLGYRWIRYGNRGLHSISPSKINRSPSRWSDHQQPILKIKAFKVMSAFTKSQSLRQTSPSSSSRSMCRIRISYVNAKTLSYWSTTMSITYTHFA